MTALLPLVGDLVRTTLVDPREAARQVLALNPGMQARWLAVALAVVLSLLVSQVVAMIVPADPANPLDTIMRDPWAGAVLHGVSIVGLAGGMAVIGGWFGGHATFPDALLLSAWADFVLLCVNVAVLAVTAFLPFLQLAGALLVAFLSLWLLAHFTAFLNGFRSLPKVMAGVVAGLLVGTFLLLLLMTALGFGPTEVPSDV